MKFVNKDAKPFVIYSNNTKRFFTEKKMLLNYSHGGISLKNYPNYWSSDLIDAKIFTSKSLVKKIIPNLAIHILNGTIECLPINEALIKSIIE